MQRQDINRGGAESVAAETWTAAAAAARTSPCLRGESGVKLHWVKHSEGKCSGR
jgi:hypothetical protein